MKLKALIFSKGFTQWQLCQRLGWQESRLSRIITGRTSPSADDLKVLALALGVSPENLEKIANHPKFKRSPQGNGLGQGRRGKK